ncbi:metallophosphoesterase family protein, partial [Bacillus cereus]|nr:metallophosphoesterase family protein [Bacillus cereus]
PMMGDYAWLYHEGRRIYVPNGHGFSIGNLPPLEAGDVFIQGHTHIPVADVENGVFILNPGSISLPKDNYPSSYGVLEGAHFTVKDF